MAGAWERGRLARGGQSPARCAEAGRTERYEERRAEREESEDARELERYATMWSGYLEEAGEG